MDKTGTVIHREDRHGDAGAIDRIAALARESRSLSVVKLSPPAAAVGLPAEIPALLQYGSDEPGVISLREFFEAYRTRPERRVGTAKVTTLLSFCDLVTRHRDEHSVIFAKTDWPQPRLLAVIDYHQINGDARFGQHKIEYAFPLTEEIKTWMEANGQLMEQAEFAAFLEEHAAELAAPDDGEKSEYERLFKERFAVPAEIIDLSRSLEILVGQKVKRAERLQTGERTVRFETEHMTAKGEAVDIPGLFMVSVCAFGDGEPVRIPARLRYRVSGTDIKWAYHLYRAAHWLKIQVQNDLANAVKETGLPGFEGIPEGWADQCRA